MLLHMIDGEQVTSWIELRPKTFRALPSTLSRLRQRRLAHLAVATERDLYLWCRDRESD